MIADVFVSRAVPRQRRLDKKKKKQKRGEAFGDAACFASSDHVRHSVLHQFAERAPHCESQLAGCPPASDTRFAGAASADKLASFPKPPSLHQSHSAGTHLDHAPQLSPRLLCCTLLSACKPPRTSILTASGLATRWTQHRRLHHSRCHASTARRVPASCFSAVVRSCFQLCWLHRRSLSMSGQRSVCTSWCMLPSALFLRLLGASSSCVQQCTRAGAIAATRSSIVAQRIIKHRQDQQSAAHSFSAAAARITGRKTTSLQICAPSSCTTRAFNMPPLQTHAGPEHCACCSAMVAECLLAAAFCSLSLRGCCC